MEKLFSLLVKNTSRLGESKVILAGIFINTYDKCGHIEDVQKVLQESKFIKVAIKDHGTKLISTDNIYEISEYK